MKTIVQYQCEICSKKYSSEAEAIICEATGIFKTSIWKQGLMYEYHHNGFVGIFAFPKDASYVAGASYNQHYGFSPKWACRATGYGDSLGKELCGGYNFRNGIEAEWIKYSFIYKHLNGPEYKRMVSYLQSQGITPSYYNKKGELIIVSEIQIIK